MLSTAHDVADARLHRISAGLAHAGITHDVWALGHAHHAPGTAADVRARSRVGPAGRLLRALTDPWRARGNQMVIDPDLVPMALLATRLRRNKLIVDVHEDYRKVAADRPWSRGIVRLLAQAAASATTRLAARADLIVVADDHLPPQQARRRLVVRNLPSTGEIARSSERDAAPRAVYIGDVRTSRGLFTMLDALGKAPGWHLDIVGNLAARETPPAEEAVRRLGLQERVCFHGRLPPDQAWAIATGGWCGLALLQDTPAYREAIPTKLYEYLLAGLPVITSDLPRMRALVEAGQVGEVASEPAQVAAILRRWLADDTELDRLARNARRWADQELMGASPFDHFAREAHKLLALN